MIAQIALQLAMDGRHRETAEGPPKPRVVTIDRPYERDVRDLLQILVDLRARAVAPRERPPP
jgi:hypothetical protein